MHYTISMKKSPVVLAIVLLLLSSLLSGCASSPPAEGAPEFEFNVVTKEITKYNGSSKDVAIPAEINGMPVVNIGERSFYNKKLESVSIPAGILSIREGAFLKNNITRITLPEGIIHIGAKAFDNNYLVRLNIPSSVTFIGNHAFGNFWVTKNVPIVPGIYRIEEYPPFEGADKNLWLKRWVRTNQ
jgi:hypothetical protein